MKSTCWDTRATDSKIKGGQKDTEASIYGLLLCYENSANTYFEKVTKFQDYSFCRFGILRH